MCGRTQSQALPNRKAARKLAKRTRKKVKEVQQKVLAHDNTQTTTAPPPINKLHHHGATTTNAAGDNTGHAPGFWLTDYAVK